MITKYDASRLRFPHNLCCIFLAGAVAAGGFVFGQSAQPTSPTPKAGLPPTPTRYAPNRPPRRETEYYSTVWGVDSFSVKAVESGELIRFTYRVVDSERAKALNDKKNEAFLISSTAHIKLVVPSLEKVGQLRQSSAPVAGNTYWMAFSNPGRPVKHGDRVDIEIGQFHVQGLLVQ